MSTNPNRALHVLPTEEGTPGKKAHPKDAPIPGAFPPLMTVGQVARILLVDDTTVRRWIKQGILESVQLPHRNKRQAYRVRADTVARLLQSEGGNTDEELH